METIYLAGGCFWCTEAVFLQVKGVERVIPGYMGGTVPNPTYEQVSGGETGHTETVRVDFDTAVISCADILDIFFEIHDPTSYHRQGNDVGSQYRSAIFYTTDAQKKEIGEAIARAERAHTDPVITIVSKAREFYEAEAYHHRYYAQHPTQSYCMLVISPKLEKFQKEFPDKHV